MISRDKRRITAFIFALAAARVVHIILFIINVYNDQHRRCDYHYSKYIEGAFYSV